MPATIESRINDVTSDLDAALAEIEQKCQSIRWRLAHFPVDQAVPDLEEEINRLIGEAGRVGVVYGEVRGVVQIEAKVRDNKGSIGDKIAVGGVGYDPVVIGFETPDSSVSQPEPAPMFTVPEPQGAIIPVAVRWHRERSDGRDRWGYGPYRIEREPYDAWWMISRSGIDLDTVFPLKDAKHLVERLHDIEANGCSILGQLGPENLRICYDGQEIVTGPKLVYLLNEAEKFLAGLKHMVVGA